MEARERILSGSDKLFRKFGIRSVSMDDIARELGMSKKTIYSFFSNKSEIVYSVTSEHIAQEKCDFEEIHGKASNAVEEFIMVMSWLRKTMAEMSATMIYDVQKYYPEAWKLFQEFKMKTIYKHILENLEKGVEEGLYRPNMNLDIITRLRLEEIEIGFRENVFPHEEYDTTEVQVELLSHFFHGITTIKGRKLINKYLNVTEDE